MNSFNFDANEMFDYILFQLHRANQWRSGEMCEINNEQTKEFCEKQACDFENSAKQICIFLQISRPIFSGPFKIFEYKNSKIETNIEIVRFLEDRIEKFQKTI